MAKSWKKMLPNFATRKSNREEKSTSPFRLFKSYDDQRQDPQDWLAEDLAAPDRTAPGAMVG